MSSREERLKYEGDVAYDVWRAGGNPDAIDLDRIDDHYYEGAYADEAAAAELRHQAADRERAEYEDSMARAQEEAQWQPE